MRDHHDATTATAACTDPDAVSDQPLAVFVHVHYLDVWEEIAAQIDACMAAPFQLVLTSSLDPRSLAIPLSPLLRKTTIIEAENRGRDIRPFLTALGQSDDFTVGLKLHTKRSTHRLDGEQWRKAIVGSLLPSREGVAAIVETMASDPRIGLVAPQNLLLSMERWLGKNEAGMRVAASAMDIKLSREAIHGSHFAAGSMFWFKRDALSPFLEPGLLPLFETEEGQVDGTIAHAIERLFALVAESRGHVTLSVDVLSDVDPGISIQALRALSQARTDQPTPYFRRLPGFVRMLDRHLPIAKAGYLRLPPAARRLLRDLLMRRS